ncbi:prepilin peptidase [Synechococcus sp. CS-602]|uniref:prepilin peptidase n=1 Tax=Synechococcaceae TaxID=1890426 RepID=UPI0008FF62A2|nr:MULTISPECIES: A24 family peptidase [Synechococcaceae]MCT0202083.1 prepilin peptidase [Synechococcus sp. CS-603]MCT0244861.1 prepilin peptidase [Synechococcus sp. CS-601]MCT4365104.1 prepilin peptidase [Candidatus Regnicoccus frigidus MAG-AL1]APD47268.1 prepilin peptidase [Synechococcus sp. SynAce01]MCT0205737.1 prepilin peptidase [Synechococcus sp. CS-602]
MTLQTAAPALSITPGLAILVALLGACVGSFLNVVIHRVPRRESILYPPSHCPRCGTSLRWQHNLPLISWLLLRGCCADCQRPIAIRYPLIELLSAGLWIAMLFARPGAMATPPTWMLLSAGWLLVSWLLPLALIDCDHLWLPEPLCRWGLVLGLAVTALLGLSQSAATARELLADHLLAATAGLLAFEGLSALAERLIGRPALGLGDAKLAALLGAWLGWQGLWVAVMLAVLTGALLGGAARLGGLLGPREPFPFGPFLAFGGIATWVAGESWWLSQLQILSGGASL